MTVYFTADPAQVGTATGIHGAELVVEQPPTLRSGAPAPAYPAELLARGLSGRTVVQVTVTTEGEIDPSSVQVVQSDHPLFTEAVRAILPRLRFDPARLGPGGRAVEARLQLPFEFTAPPPPPPAT